MFEDNFLFGLVTTGLLLTTGHWLPWPRRLHRLAAYTYGVASILAGAAAWLGSLGQWWLVLGLAAFAAVGGAATSLCYLVDWALNARLRLRTDA